MNLAIRKGFGFGLTSSIITTLALIVGLNSSTGSRLAIIGGIVVIAVADALSDAMAMHISEEFEFKHKVKEIWHATFATFWSKFIFAAVFIIPVLLFELSTAITISIIWGLSLITGFSYYLAKKQNIKPYKVVSEHLLITIAVIVISHYLGVLIAALI